MNRVSDAGLIRSVMAHPDIWPHIGDDYSGQAEDWMPVIHDSIVYLMPDDRGACFMLHPHSVTLWEVHSAVLPAFRGHSVGYTKAIVKWLSENTQCRHLMTLIPQGNFRARRLAEAAGMVQEGLFPRSFMKGGELIDQAVFGMEIEPCQQQQ